MKDFVNLADFQGDPLRRLLDRAIRDKGEFQAGRLRPLLERKTLAMFFEKASNRTRVSFESAMTHLGGHAIHLTQADIGLGTREPVQDVARVLGRMCDGIMTRTFSHETVEQLARWSPVPVINGLTDRSHPCQAMGDMMTAQEQFGRVDGLTWAFVGDGNNVARSLAMLCGKLGARFILAAPEGYGFDRAFLSELQRCCQRPRTEMTADPHEAVRDADLVYTDTWVSMGQEQQKRERRQDFAGFQVNEELMSRAPRHAVVMHCLPAYRGYEISEPTLEAHAETIFRQAENRQHFQRTLLAVLLGEGGIA